MLWLKQHFWLILALLIAVMAGSSLLTGAHFYTHDDIMVFRVNEFIECFRQGQIPCRWSYNLGLGYGAPWFNFYPPLIYVLPALLHLMGLSLTLSVNLFVFSTFLLAAWSMYRLVTTLTGHRELGFFSSLLYTLYPFHAVNVFIRGVWAENLVWSFAPLVLLAIYRQVQASRFARALPLLFALTFLTHIISSFIMLGLAIFWVIAVAYVAHKPVLPELKRLTLAVLLALGMAAFFFVPALAEKNLVQSTSLTTGYYHYANHFVSLRQLFIEYKWNYGASLWSDPSEEMPFMVGHVHLSLLVLLLTLLMVVKRTKRRFVLGLLLLLPFAAFIFLSHARSIPIWGILSPMAYIQFPWRFVVWAGLPLVATIGLLSANFPWKIRLILVIIGSSLALLYSRGFFHPRAFDQISAYDLIQGEQKYVQQSKTLYDYMPVTVLQVPPDFADNATFPVKVFYFPGWRARDAEGRELAIKASVPYGLIESVSGENIAELKWHETPFRLLMDVISILSLLVYLSYLSRTSHVQ